MKHIAPSLTKIVRVQNTRKMLEPAVVIALPIVAVPMVFMANAVRLTLFAER